MHARELTRHAVSISGAVVDNVSGQPVPGCQVDIVQGPPEFERLRQALSAAPGWAARAQRLDRTICRDDGLFYFLDLPAGTYMLQGRAPAWGTRYGQTPIVSVAAATRDATGHLQFAPAVLRLPPTRVHGIVTRQDNHAAIAGARVGLRGDTNAVMTGADGTYALTGLTATGDGAPQPTIVASAAGFDSASQVMALVQGQDKEVNLELKATAG